MNFEQDVILASKEKPVLVDFSASWCGPCKIMKPMLQALNNTRDDFNLVIIDVDENQELARQYRVRAIPTILVFQDGKITDQYIGGPSLAKLNEWIDSFNDVKEKV